MKNLLSDLDTWRERLARRPLAIFLDYDGTLSAIAPTPGEATLPLRTKETLKALVRLRDVKVAVISGRAFGVLKDLVRVPGLSYVGSHGAEFSLPGGKPRKLSRKYYLALQGLEQRVRSGLGGMPGVLLEHKPASFAVHYRKAVPSVEKKVKRLIAQACGGPVRREEISLMRGKKVIEIVSPHAMNKGQAARRLLRRWGRKKFLPIFIGDDRTDETAFEVFREGGLTVRVGRTATSSRAGYYVNTVEDVRTLLSTIVCFRGKYS